MTWAIAGWGAVIGLLACAWKWRWDLQVLIFLEGFRLARNWKLIENEEEEKHG